MQNRKAGVRTGAVSHHHHHPQRAPPPHRKAPNTNTSVSSTILDGDEVENEYPAAGGGAGGGGGGGETMARSSPLGGILGGIFNRGVKTDGGYGVEPDSNSCPSGAGFGLVLKDRGNSGGGGVTNTRGVKGHHHHHHHSSSGLVQDDDVMAADPVAIGGDEAVEIAVDVTRLLVQSYFDIVRGNLQDLVPKAIMRFLVLKSTKGMHQHLLTTLYHGSKSNTVNHKTTSHGEQARNSELSTVDALLQERPDVVNRRRECAVAVEAL